MGEGYPVGNRAAPLLIALAATLSVALLLSAMPTVGAAEQQPVIISNGSLCSGVNGDGGGEDGGCFTIGQVQPELEGFEMAVDLGSGGVFHRQLLVNYDKFKVGNSINPNQAGCGRHNPNSPYYPCTTADSKAARNAQKCGQFTRAGQSCH